MAKEKEKKTASAKNNRVARAVTPEEERRMVNKMSIVGIAGNVVLSAGKFACGVFGSSGAMISDALHSLSDVFATAIAYLGVRLSRKEADKKHPYGHERLECLASLVLACILAVTGVGIGWVGVQKILAGNYDQLVVPNALALGAAVVSIIVKEAMFWYTRHYARIMNSSAFMADAWHHRSDSLSSVGALIGIGGAMLGFPVCDPIASVVICLFVLKAAYDIVREAVDKMLDTAVDDELVEAITEVIRQTPGVIKVDKVLTRQFGSKIYVDAEIAADGNLTLYQAHGFAEDAHNRVEQAFPNVKHIMIHVNPAE